ncbi:hypothetical protein ACHWQZ_G014115 [Mnemiopsis leidyi]
MGVQGLWKLLENTGHTVPLEAMSHKVLAVDVSIWLNQIIKAMRDAEGNRLANAHIIAVYHRICKLLFYQVKPVVIFDGEVPEIKRRTCAKRKALKSRAAEVAVSQRREKIQLSLQKLAVAHVMGKELEPPQPVENRSISETDKNDMFYLEPQIANKMFDDENEDLDQVPLSKSVHVSSQSKKIDPFSKEFQSLPADVQHELLIEHIEYTKERAKIVSYAQGSSSDNFSQNQIENVVAKNNLNKRLSELRKLLKENSSSQEQNGHTVQVFKSGRDSEIVFTKQINNTDYDILNTRRQKKVKQVIKIEEKMKITVPVREEEESSKSEDMKNLFFGSDSEEEKVEESDSDSGDDREIKNVLGLSKGHPGTFRNPYSNKMKKNNAEVQLKLNDGEYLDVSSSSESEFEDVQEVLQISENKKDSNYIAEVKNNSQKSAQKIADSDNDMNEVTLVTQATKSGSIVGGRSDNSTSNLDPSEEPNIILPAVELLQPQKSDSEMISDQPTEALEKTNTTEALDHDDISRSQHSSGEKAVDLVSAASDPSVGKESLTTEFDPFIEEIKNNLQSSVNLETLQDNISEELEAVRTKHRKAKAVSDTVNKGIITDVKELLTIFGVPFLDAPGEAEAQCAELCNLGICDGVITNDSDIFLFGNVCVYKDVFKKDRDMRCFTSDEVEQTLGLSRRSLIDIAQLVGSDYCSGVRKIGCVLALEIISKYKTLARFVELPEVETKYKKFDLSSLPDSAAVQAYLYPNVNRSREEFTWNDIDICLIKDFLFKKLGWRGSKVDETLKPVLESLKSKTSQKSITNFFSVSKPKAPSSKRVQNAIGGIKGGPSHSNSKKRKITAKNTASMTFKGTFHSKTHDYGPSYYITFRIDILHRFIS